MYNDILEESWVYQETKLEGKLEALRKTALNLVQAHFPEVLSVTKTQIDGIKEEGVLQNLILQISFAQKNGDVLRALADLDNSK